MIELDLYEYRLTEEGSEIKKELTRDCVRLGAMLILYRVLNYLTGYLIYPVVYYVFSGKTAGYSTAVQALTTDYKEQISTTAFRMMMNSVITVLSLALTIAVGYIVLGFSFKGFLKPSREGAKKGATE